MSIQAAGVRLDLDAPRPVAPDYSLLKVPGVVVPDDGRWLNGVNLDTYPTDVPSLWEPCSAGTYRTKGEGTGLDVPQFDAFVIYIPGTCSTFSLGTLKEMTAVQFDAVQSYGVEDGFVGGVPGSVNPYPADVNLNALGGGAVTPAVGLSYLENAIGQTGVKGLIFATPAIVAALKADKLETDETGSVLLSPNGTPVVSATGIIGLKPDTQAAPAAGQDWMFATGPVEVRLGPVMISDLVTSLDRADNTVTFRAERYVLATWDTSLQVGVLVDWTP